MKRLLCAVSISVALMGTACSTTGKNTGPNSSNTASKKSAGSSNSVVDGATVGALSGAAIGGGLGAIVGSTSGHLGEGIAVGALAGGVAGAGVGAAVGDYKGKQAARRDTLNDQDRQLKQQRKELDSVKDSLGDELSYKRQSAPGSITTANLSSGGRPGYGMAADGYGIRENYRGHPQAKPYRTSGGSIIPASVAMKRSGRARMAESVHARAGRNSVRTVKFSENSPPAKNTLAVASSYKGNTAIKSDESERLPAADELSGFGGIEEAPVRAVSRNGAITPGTVSTGGAGLPAAKSEASLGVQAAALTAGSKTAAGVEKTLETAASTVKGESSADGTVVAKQLGKVPADGSAACIQAEKEAARATNATSDADRLFYLGRASRLCPSSDTYQVELGKVFTKIGKIQEAKGAFRKAAELNPQNDVAHDELSILENSTH